MLSLSLHLATPITLNIKSHSDATITALLGKSGSGKTSLLRALAGLNKSHGEVVLNNSDINMQPCHSRQIAFVQQKPQLFPHWTIQQHIQNIRKKSSSNKLKILPLCSELGINDVLSHYPQQLSGGQIQRLALLLALLREPQLLLLDEPFSALDEAAKREIFPILRSSLKTLNAQAVLVSHQVRDCAALANHCWILAEGSINFQGSISAGIRRYSGESSQAALLQANFIEYQIDSNLSRFQIKSNTSNSGHSNILEANQFLFCRGDYSARLSENTRIMLYADDIGISLQPPEHSSFANCLKLTITQAKNDTYGLLLSAGLFEQELYIHITKNSWNKLQLSIGQEIYAVFKAGAVDIL